MTRECHVRFRESAEVRSLRATHLVVGFEHEDDARRFLDMMHTRLEEFALSLHPEKTRLIEFGRHAAADREQRGMGKPETFNFLGSPSSVVSPERAASLLRGRHGKTV